MARIAMFALLVSVVGCDKETSPPAKAKAKAEAKQATKAEPEARAEPKPDDAGPHLADVTGVLVTGEPGSYDFAVTVESPDTGCERYANWWEVVSEDGKLLYRRILRHSHIDDQPFTRNGGPVEIDAKTTVIVRAHMHPTGYGGAAMKGTPGGTFEPTTPASDFATGLATQEPLPTGCLR